MPARKMKPTARKGTTPAARKKLTKSATRKSSGVRKKTPKKELTIYFVGLCLFTKGGDDEMHVFLPRPQALPYPMAHEMSQGSAHGMAHDRTHRATLLTPKAFGWSAREIPAGKTLTFGDVGQGGTMPDEAVLSNVSSLPLGRKLPRGQAKADTKVKGAHVVLRGGRLTVPGAIGRWAVAGQSAEAHFPSVVQWTGLDASGDPNDALAIWNSPLDESPTLGNPSTIPHPNLSDEEMARRAADHFMAYYHILAGVPGPKITYLGLQKRLSVVENIFSLIVSSCPSGGGDLYP
jgi:hypothetical protein